MAPQIDVSRLQYSDDVPQVCGIRKLRKGSTRLICDQSAGHTEALSRLAPIKLCHTRFACLRVDSALFCLICMRRSRQSLNPPFPLLMDAVAYQDCLGRFREGYSRYAQVPSQYAGSRIQRVGLRLIPLMDVGNGLQEVHLVNSSSLHISSRDCHPCFFTQQYLGVQTCHRGNVLEISDQSTDVCSRKIHAMPTNLMPMPKTLRCNAIFSDTSHHRLRRQ